jgi:hypothetical protein
MIEIIGEYVSLAVDGKAVTTARFSRHAAGGGNGAWTVSSFCHRSAARHVLSVIAAVYSAITYGLPLGTWGHP